MSVTRPLRVDRGHVLKGGLWIYGRTVLGNVLNVAAIAVVARHLTPADFGVAALALVTLKLLTVLGTEGINQFIIHDHKPGHEARTQAAFWLDLALSCGCVAVGLMLVPFVARFYGEPRLTPMLFLMLVAVPLNSLSKVPDALLRKALDFKTLEIRDASIAGCVAALMVWMALDGWGPWSLIVPGIMASLLRVFIVFHLSSWRPRLHAYFHLWPSVFVFYRNITGSAVTSFVLTEGDTLLIGKFMGSGALGIYNVAWQAANFVNRSIVNVANRMALPVLAASSGSILQKGDALKAMLRLLAGVTFPLIAGLFVLADEFVLAIYGPQWVAAVIPLRILLIYALRYSVSPPIGAFFQAIGRPDVNFKVGASFVPVYLGAIWWGTSYGLVGVAAAVTLVRTVLGFVTFYIAARFLNTSFGEMVRPLLAPFYASCVMAALLFLAKARIGDLVGGSHVWNLIVLTGTGGILYLMVIRLAFNLLAQDIAKLTAPLVGSGQTIVRRVLNVR